MYIKKDTILALETNLLVKGGNKYEVKIPGLLVYDVLKLSDFYSQILCVATSDIG